MPIYVGVLTALAAAVLAGAVFYFLGQKAGRRLERSLADAEGRSAAKISERTLADARRDAEAVKTEAELEGKRVVLQAREGWEVEEKGRRQELTRLERRLEERETLLEQKFLQLDTRVVDAKRREEGLGEREHALEGERSALRAETEVHAGRVEKLAGMTAQDAKDQLIRDMQDEARSDAAALAREIKDEARRTADLEGKKILALAIQRMASEYASEVAVSAVALPNDEMKGRIIGREGRNIRAFETSTGVDVIIDDTPDTVIVSCFDPIRREIARLALEQLITDGRIHPGRIEEVVTKVTEQLNAHIQEAGEQAAYDVGVHGLHPELIKLVGRMKYRTSYGQNMYHHSKEVAHLAGVMAAELKLDVGLAKRGGLLHDIGKVLTHQHEGTHVELGVEVATRYGENATVINCIAAHHDDVPHESPISVLVQAADSASGGRPGARREAFESYVKRLTRLEEIANGFPGVEKTFAIQAGREVRIVVSPERVDDQAASQMADDIARAIESELQYPGQIKVVVVRETRAVDVAR